MNAIDHQAAFLETVRQALSDVRPGRRPDIMTPDVPRDCQAGLDAYTGRSRAGQAALLSRLEENGPPLHLNIVPVATVQDAQKSIITLIKEKEPEYGTVKKVSAWRHPLIDRLDLGPALDKLGIPLAVPKTVASRENREWFRKAVTGSFVGITSADYCVAETATLTMKTRAGQPRSVSLLPMIHVAVIHQAQLVENLTELYYRLQWDPEEQDQGLTNCMTFISGPSKTGDIELVIVHGAHGPRELYLYVLTCDPSHGWTNRSKPCGRTPGATHMESEAQ